MVGLAVPATAHPMKERLSHIVPLALAIGVAGGLLWWLQQPGGGRAMAANPAQPDEEGVASPGSQLEPDAETLARLRSATAEGTGLLAQFLQELDPAHARTNEAVLTFKDAAAYRAFLGRAGAAGLQVLGRIDGLLTARVRYPSLSALQTEVAGNTADYADVSANILVLAPTLPPPEARAGVQQVPINNNLLASLGVAGDHSQWGGGVTIAVLDSGVAPDPTFGSRVQYLDVGLGTGVSPGDSHGTSVASIAAGMAADAPGIAPAADILSVRITAADGTSDLFTLSQAIMAAVDKGAQVVNISMGSYSTTGLLSSAIDYAGQHGVVVVASAGNDQASQLVWPAADPRVASVGAVDAVEQQVIFSNAGPQLKITAPGYDVQTAGLDGQRVLFTGTSASAPVVAGAIAAMISQNPGMDATQAWQVLQQFASDAGTPGPDPNYGNGIVNLGWAMNRADASRIDTAVASPTYDPLSSSVTYLVQNRSGMGMGGMQLNLDISGVPSSYTLPWLDPGATTVVQAPIDPSRLTAAGSLVLRAQLVNPPGFQDVVPANNRRASVLTPPPAK